jgi:aldose 1-epimerase
MGGGIITLSAGESRVRVDPALGGAIVRYWSEGSAGEAHWLRPGPDAGPVPVETMRMGCFPLVPFSNRIRNGRFTFRGQTISLPLNFGAHPHTIHGQGWQARWEVTELAEYRIVLAYRHAADAWPFDYLATQDISLSEDRLTVRLSLENQSGAGMPAGLGLHPYFPRTPGTTLTAHVDGMWQTDGGGIPTRLAPPPAALLENGLRVDEVPLDNAFTGWSRAATIEWPERGGRLILTGSEGLDVLAVYTPPGKGFFCAEPVSHGTDAFNRADAGERGTGMRVLAPGERWAVSMTLRPERTA